MDIAFLILTIAFLWLLTTMNKKGGETPTDWEERQW